MSPTSAYIFTNGRETVESASMFLDQAVTDRLTAGGPLTIVERFADGSSRPILVDGKPPVPVASTPAEVAPVAASTPAEVAPAADFTRPLADLVASPAKVNGQMDHDARARIEAQDATLRAGGVHADRTQQVAASGTRMADSGYATQEARAVEHAAKMSASDACDALVARVESEQRRNIVVSCADAARNLNANGKLTLYGHRLTVNAIRGLSARCDSAPFGAYVLGLYERIVANVSEAKTIEALPARTGEQDTHAKALRVQAHEDRAKMAEILTFELARAGDSRMTLRLRDAGPCDVFAALGPSYGVADPPQVIPQVRDAMPSDARATWAYDPSSTAWEVRASIWTPTPVSEQAIGEAFEGFVSYRSKDNGGSRLHGGGGVVFLRCYNASVYEALGATVARIHRGKILDDVASMTKGALSAIEALCAAWGTTRQDVIEIPSTVTIEDAIPGFWRSLLTDSRELAGVLPGKKVERVKQLSAAYFDQRRDSSRVLRSDFAQAWTSAIQREDAEVRRDAEAAIGGWLVGSRRALRCDLPTREVPATK